jgi:hypothetical protein
MPIPRRFLLPALALCAVVVVAGSVVVEALPRQDERPMTVTSGVPMLFRPPPLELRAPTPSLGERAVSFALREVGVPYHWGGDSPSGFDCSGLVRWSYLHVGIDLPHSSYALYGRGRRVSAGRMKPGDVLFFDGLGHVGLYVGHGRMVHAPYTGRDVEVVSLGRWGGHFIAARRVAPA